MENCDLFFEKMICCCILFLKKIKYERYLMTLKSTTCNILPLEHLAELGGLSVSGR